VAKTAGFCMGVQRALDLVLDSGTDSQAHGCTDESELSTLGPLIHNDQALEALRARGIRTAKDLSDVKSKAVVIRAHGAGPTVRAQIAARDLRVIDATCPRVVRCQKAVQRASAAGRQIIIAGDRDHAEVSALVDFARSGATVISTVAEAEALEVAPPITLLAQTTFNSKTYAEIAAALSRRLEGKDEDALEIVRSLCRSTEERQLETIELARAVDAVVVVGGKHSANTRRLAEVARDLGRPTFHIETADELNADDFTSRATVGVTAGASTPAWVTESVVERLKGFGSPFRRAVRSLTEAALGSNMLLAVAVASVALAASLSTGETAPAGALFVAFAYAFFAYSANSSGDDSIPRIALSARVGFFLQHRFGIAVLALALSAAALVVAFRMSTEAGIALLAADAFAALYSLRILPSGFGRGRMKRVRDIPGSKDVMIALAWVFVALVLPALAGGTDGAGESGAGPSAAALLLAGAAVFALSFSASTTLTLGDVQSDRLIGRETFAMLIGRQPARIAATTAALAVAITTSTASVVGWLPPPSLGLAFSALMVMIASVGRRRPGDALRVGMSVQTALLAAGPVAYLLRFL
jgi:(E)-4-hydroxy-3-methyl-but-2-enyl pyrophosphate reductase